MILAGSGDGLLHLGGDLRGVRCPGAEHDLETGIKMPDRPDQVDDPLLACDAAYKQNIGAFRIHPKGA